MPNLEFWRRLALIAIGGTVVTVIADSLKQGYLTAVVIGVVGSAFFHPLGKWLDSATGTPIQAAQATNPAQSSAAPPATVPASGIALTIFYVAAVSIFSLLLMNAFTASLVAGLDQLEHAELLHFTALGYAEAQKYIAGTIFAAVWLPAATALGVVLGRSQRSMKLRYFLAGGLVTMPAYFVLASMTGLAIAFNDPVQVYTALGMKPVFVDNYEMLRWTAVTIQVCVNIVLVIGLSGYPWLWAQITRGGIWTLAKLGFSMA